MGGYGSGWQGSKKTTVEGSLVLTASSLVRKRALVAGAWTSGSWGWTYDGEDKPHATIGFEANLTDRDNAWLRLHYRRNDEAIDYKVRLVASTPHYGGLRWWFICPLVRNDGGPPRRVAKLYLPCGGKYFGSREGYGLTYTSCQESGNSRGLYRLLAAEIPTASEVGLPDLVTEQFIGLFAPAGTPRAIIEQIALATRSALADPDFQQRLFALGFEAAPDSSPGKMQRIVESEFTYWTPVIKSIGLKLD